LRHLLGIFDKCGSQNLVNLIGGNVNKYQVLFWKREKKHQQIELLSFVSVLMVSTKAFTKEKSLFCFCHFSPFAIASNQID